MFRCHVCGSDKARPDIVTQMFRIDGKPVIVENIPANICIRCKEVVFDISTAENIRSMVHGKARPIKSVMTDVFDFA